MTLSEIQQELKKTWTLESYSKDFKAVQLSYRDFQHTLLHVMKATGKLASLVEAGDHEQREGVVMFRGEDVTKYLADLVICAIRMASKNPIIEVDIEKAVIDRIREKADVPVVNKA